MAFKYPNLVSEFTSSTGGAGDILLDGPEAPYFAFSARLPLGFETTVIRSDGLDEEELRVRLAAPRDDGKWRLTVLKVYGSTNGGDRIVWPAGQQRVYATLLGDFALIPPDAEQAGRPVVVQPDGTYGAGSLGLPSPTGLTLGQILDVTAEGATVVHLVATWNAVAAADVTYEVQMRAGRTGTGDWPDIAGSAASYPAGSAERYVATVVSGYTYGLKVRARSVGGVSDWSAEETIAVDADNVPPGTPTVESLTGVFGAVVAVLVPPDDADLDTCRMYGADAADGPWALVDSGLPRLSDSGLRAGATRWYRFTAVDLTGNESAPTAPLSASTVLIEAGDLAADLSGTIGQITDLFGGVNPADLIDSAGTAALDSVLAAIELKRQSDVALQGAVDLLDQAQRDSAASLSADLLRSVSDLQQRIADVNAQTIADIDQRLDGLETGVSSEAAARQDADTALGQRVDQVNAVVAGNTASIQTEATARADADTALGTRIDTVAAKADGTLAAIQTEATARTDGDTALGTRIDTVVASAGTNAAAITAEATARANADGALSSRIDTVVASAGANATAIQTEATARADGDTALGTRIDTVMASAGTNAAAITAEATARANADGALSSRIDTVVASAGANATAIQTEATARADGDTALGTRIDTVVASAGTNAAAITAEATARANADGALSSRIDTVVASAGANATAIQTEATARADGDTALGTRIDTVVASAGTNAAAITAEASARANADGALSSRIDTVVASAGANATAIQTEAIARADGDTALGTRIDTVVASAGTNAAAITAEATARATADGTLSSRIDTVVASAGANATAIQTEATARADGDIALGTRIDTVVARASTNTAAITAEATARSTADGALSSRIDTVVASAGANATAIQTEVTARADGDTALGTRIDTVQTTVNGHTASIQQQASSIGGLSAQWTLKLNAGGRVVGIGAAASADVSELVLMADALKVVSTINGAPVVPFAVVNGVATFNTAMMGQAWIADTHIGPNGIDARFLRAGTAIADTVLVGGATLSSVVANAATGAQDPAVRINAGSTAISGGRITVTGARVVADMGGWFYADTTEINGGAVRARTLEGVSLKAGSVTVTELATFATGNMLSNSDFSCGMECWNRIGGSPNASEVTGGTDLPGWAPAGGHALWIRQNGTDSGNYWQRFYAHPAANWGGLSVVAGETYEFSVYTGAHRCSVYLRIAWYDAAGTLITETNDAAAYNDAAANGGTSLASYKRLWMKAAAPAGAATARPEFIKNGTKAGYSDSYGFFALPFFGVSAPNATGPQPWCPGGMTIVTGGMLANERIITNSAQLGDATVTTLKIGANQVTVPVYGSTPETRLLPADHSWIAGSGAWGLTSIGQPIEIFMSMVQISTGTGVVIPNNKPLAEVVIQRFRWNGSGWVYEADLLPYLGGSINDAIGQSAPWSYSAVDTTQGAGTFGYQYSVRRADAGASSVASAYIAYCTCLAMEVRR